MVIRKEDDTAKVHLDDIASVVLQTNQAFVSAYLLSELTKKKISFVVSDEKKNPIGQYLPLYGAHNVSKRIGEQLEWSEPSKKRVWQHVVQDKISNQAALLALVRKKNARSAFMRLCQRFVLATRRIAKAQQPGFIWQRIFSR